MRNKMIKTGTRNILTRLLITGLLFFIFLGNMAEGKTLQDKNTRRSQAVAMKYNYQENSQRKVTLHLQNVMLSEALHKLSRKANVGISFDYQQIPPIKINYKCNNKDFYTVLRDLLRNTNLTPTLSDDRKVVILRKKQAIQTGTIAGQVTDAQTGETLPGANVFLVGTTKGKSTDKDGKYRIDDVEFGGYTIAVTFVGYERQEKEVVIEEDRTVTVDFSMEKSTSEIGEMVVTGYGSIEKRELTSSITTLGEDELGSETQGSIDKMLQGKSPGVSVIQSSGAVGSVPVVRIRGSSTLTGNSQPLWVVDGFVLEDPVPLSPAEINSPNAINRIGNSISGINPSDIESINILKDASATAIYGVRAAEGVVVLTTKSGQRGDLRVNVRSTVSLTEALTYDRFNLMNSKERINIEEYYFNLGSEQYYNADANVNSVGLAGAYARYKNRELETWADFQQAVRNAETYNTDWFDILYRNSLSTYNTLSFSGGSDNISYRASFSATNQQGTDILTDNDRYTGRLKIDFNLSDDIDLTVDLSGNTRKRSSYPRSLTPPSITNFSRPTPQPFEYALNTSRTFPLQNQNGDYYMYRGHDDFYLFNIMNEYDNSDQTNKTNEFATRATISWNALDNLFLTGKFGYSLGDTHNETYYTAQTNQVASIRQSNFGDPVPEDSNLPRGGVIFSRNDFRNSYEGRFSVQYLPIDNNFHSLETLAGVEYNQNTYRGDYTTGWGYLHDRGRIVSPDENLAEELGGIPYLNITDFTQKSASYFGIATYTYDERYTINGNIRFDGSNQFGSNPEYRWKPAWSVSGRWNISSEAFMQKVDFVNQLSLRASYGVTGSTNTQNTPQIVASFLAPAYWSDLNLLEIEQPANPNLRWEKTYTTNVGLDFSLISDRVYGSVDVYEKQSEDLIINTRISEVNGYSFLPINFADVSNKGVEFGFNTVNIRKKNFSWETGINFSYNRNRVEKVNLQADVERMLSSSPYKPDAAIVGRPLSALYSVEFAGVDPSNGVARFWYANGDTTVARTGLEFGINDLIYNGPIEAPYTGGFSNTFQYKNAELSFFFTFGFGNKLRMDDILESWMYSPDQNLSKELLNAWGVNGNTDTYVPNILVQTGSDTHKDRWNQSDIRVANGSYLRLQNMRLKYNLPSSFLKNIGIPSAYVQVEGNNLLLFSDDKLNGFDPETFTYNALPNMRSYAMTINVTF